ncbi:MAG: class I SAM-dependent methyltransferase [Candidatus Promineifilaceae bacterium]|nr:class I SAM-dependent methyltransferase [Candidatus Promineifilaceae bacterium]
MNTHAFDPDQFKENRLQRWDESAPAWQRFGEIWDRATQHISDRLIELAEIETGQRVLDIATGLGEPAVSAARRVGSTGQVVATDVSPVMLALARERATAIGIDNIEFQQIDAEQLDFPGASFDAALSRWGITEFPNLSVALQRIRQHLSTPGQFAAAVWAEPAEVPFLAKPAGVLRQLFDVPPPLPGTPNPFSLGDRKQLEQALAQAGFTKIHCETHTVTIEFPSFAAFRSYLEDASPLIQDILSKQPAERQAEAWQAIADAFQQYSQHYGSLQIPNGTLCAVAKG